MHATTATCLLGGSGSGPLKVAAYSALLARYSSVTLMNRAFLYQGNLGLARTDRQLPATGAGARDSRSSSGMAWTRRPGGDALEKMPWRRCLGEDALEGCPGGATRRGRAAGHANDTIHFHPVRTSPPRYSWVTLGSAHASTSKPPG